MDPFSTYYLDKWTELTHFGQKTLAQLEVEIEGIVEEVSRLRSGVLGSLEDVFVAQNAVLKIHFHDGKLGLQSGDLLLVTFTISL